VADCNNTEDPDGDLACEIVACRKCPRLAPYIQEIARVKRRAYREWDYWGKPVPSFGGLDARLFILGLAPGAHGANRTGRVFTGDSSGNLLYRVLHATGFASQPESTSLDDGLELIDARISCVIHCAPPDNKPLPSEIRNCRTWLERELRSMPRLKVVVALGRLAFDAYLGYQGLRRGHMFGHNREWALGEGHPVLIGSYHPSQQNTSTGKLTEPMLREVFERARELLA
jgi:uracil-DNA glycosylase family 4